MLSAFVKALSQLGDPRIRAVALRSVVVASGLYVVLAALLWWGLSLAPLTLPWVGTLGGVAAFILSLLLFPAVVSLVAGFFVEEIAAAVEARHYPGLPAPRNQPLSEAMALALRFTGLVLVANLLALPLYLVPGLNVILFFGVNGYLFGREYYEMVAVRRLDGAATVALRKGARLRLWLAGAGIAGLTMVPVANLFVPILATAFMVHVFETLRRNRPDLLAISN